MRGVKTQRTSTRIYCWSLRNCFQLSLRSKHIWTPNKDAKQRCFTLPALHHQPLHFQENLRTASMQNTRKPETNPGGDLTSTNRGLQRHGPNPAPGLLPASWSSAPPTPPPPPPGLSPPKDDPRAEQICFVSVPRLRSYRNSCSTMTVCKSWKL